MKYIYANKLDDETYSINKELPDFWSVIHVDNGKTEKKYVIHEMYVPEPNAPKDISVYEVIRETDKSALLHKVASKKTIDTLLAQLEAEEKEMFGPNDDDLAKQIQTVFKRSLGREYSVR